MSIQSEYMVDDISAGTFDQMSPNTDSFKVLKRGADKIHSLRLMQILLNDMGTCFGHKINPLHSEGKFSSHVQPVC